MKEQTGEPHSTPEYWINYYLDHHGFMGSLNEVKALAELTAFFFEYVKRTIEYFAYEL